MDRATLERVSELRLCDAEALLAAGRWDAAYYLLGYVVECALKACVAKRFRLHEVPERKLLSVFYTHDLDELLRASEVKSEFDRNAKVNPGVAFNWNIVLDWSPDARYDVNKTESQARELYTAVTDCDSGVWTWLKTQY
ncbi:MAG: HEPN domain-containing protein [Candidatus Solibacter usitatus]|nr:HEPN domain-containing protein [Candidatus Solibacter usitatus]